MTSTDERDRRDFGQPPRPGDLLDRHLTRLGTPRPDDAMAQLQITLLRLHLDLTRAALDDEGVDPDTARRVLERVIYGAAPNPAETQERVRMTHEMTDRLDRAVDPTLFIGRERP